MCERRGQAVSHAGRIPPPVRRARARTRAVAAAAVVGAAAERGQVVAPGRVGVLIGVRRWVVLVLLQRVDRRERRQARRVLAVRRVLWLRKRRGRVIAQGRKRVRAVPVRLMWVVLVVVLVLLLLRVRSKRRRILGQRAMLIYSALARASRRAIAIPCIAPTGGMRPCCALVMPKRGVGSNPIVRVRQPEHIHKRTGRAGTRGHAAQLWRVVRRVVVRGRVTRARIG